MLCTRCLPDGGSVLPEPTRITLVILSCCSGLESSPLPKFHSSGYCSLTHRHPRFHSTQAIFLNLRGLRLPESPLLSLSPAPLGAWLAGPQCWVLPQFGCVVVPCGCQTPSPAHWTGPPFGPYSWTDAAGLSHNSLCVFTEVSP